MRIVFLGTPAFAVASLEALVKGGQQVVAVITAADKPAGRGLTLRQSPVKIAALNHHLPVLQPQKLTDPEFLKEVKSFQPDLMIVVAFRMMPEILWAMAPLGTFNLHASLLPQYRGAAPINRAIMNGETMTGVTTFFLKQQIDTGNIIFREQVPIGADETAGELHDKLMKTGAELVLRSVQAIEQSKVVPIAQETLTDSTTLLRTAPKLFPDDCKINWNQPAGTIHNQIRGLSPSPGATTHFISDTARLQIKLFRSAKAGNGSVSDPGTIAIESGRLFVHCATGKIEVLELQQQGKKRLSAAEFLRGFRASSQWRAE
ncbi:MAG TPA: methionyl-tRNA formyltransferase [Bacteroidia bacterium]|nr:methionyl-tRNA formyltransferase [Bacteroidia bacterium]